MRRIEMQVLEKILQEIEKEKADPEDYATVEYKRLVRNWNICIDVVAKIIRSHMEDDGWIPIAEGLPPVGKPLVVTIKDQLQGRPNECRYPVYYEKDSMKDGYHWSWRYGDFAYELLPDVSEVIAWQPLPAPYQSKEEKSDGNSM